MMTVIAKLSSVFCIVSQVTGHLMTLTSKSTLRTTNTTYSTNMDPPNGLLIFHFDIAIVAITVISITNNKKMEQTSPLLFTSTTPPLMAKYINQGIGNLKRSKIKCFTEKSFISLWLQLHFF